MISLKPITLNNINDFKGTSYDKMSFEQKLGMIQQSIKKTYNNFYFEFLTVYKNDTIIRFYESLRTLKAYYQLWPGN